MKGISLPVNSVIIIVLAILVLVLLGYMFITGTNPFVFVSYESALNNGCKVFLESGQSVDNILVGDLNKDGSSDSLLTACQLYYSNPDMDVDGCADRCRDRFPFGSGSSGGGGTDIPDDETYIVCGSKCAEKATCSWKINGDITCDDKYCSGDNPNNYNCRCKQVEDEKCE